MTLFTCIDIPNGERFMSNLNITYIKYLLQWFKNDTKFAARRYITTNKDAAILVKKSNKLL